MKKVLIIGYLWPCCAFGGGSPRTLGLARYLPEFGWQPIVLTARLAQKPALCQCRIIETGRRDVIVSLKKKLHLNPDCGLQEQLGIGLSQRENRQSLTSRLVNFSLGLITYPDIDRGWRPFALQAGQRILSEEKIDALISVWPITAHLIGYELKKRARVPWIADFSHLWSQGYNYQYGPIRKFLDQKLEKKIIKQADAVTTVSGHFAQQLKKLHQSQSIFSITHGFDPDLLNQPAAPLTPRFSITYTGHFIHQTKQKPVKLFQAIQELLQEGAIPPTQVAIHFYGGWYPWLVKEIQRFNLENIVQQGGVISRQTALKKQRQSQVLLHLGWDDPKIKGFYSSKIFDYLAAGRPILAIGGASDGVVKRLLAKTQAGAYCQDIATIKKTLKDFYLEYQQKGAASYYGNQQKIKQYSQRIMAQKFAKILDQL